MKVTGSFGVMPRRCKMTRGIVADEGAGLHVIGAGAIEPVTFDPDGIFVAADADRMNRVDVA